jgi:5-methylcytosine-specific restriction endonuclease McrA
MNKKFVLKKASLAKLNSVRTELCNEISVLQKEFDDLFIPPAELARIKQIEAEIDELEKRIIQIQRSKTYKKRKPGVVNFLLGEFELNDKGEKELGVAKESMDLLRKKRSLLSAKPHHERPYIQSQIGRKRDFLQAIESQIALLEKRKEKDLSIKNKAAQNTQQKRKLGSRVKYGLETSECPYCFSSLSQAAHADHIYPIAKGGESVPSNMVLVCESCNLKKSDLTLQQFIKKYSLNRDKIEEKLAALGKEY